MHIRGAKYSDYNEIQSLIKRNGLKQRSENDWKNLWFKNPSFNMNESTMGWVAEDKDKIIGYFGTFPMKYYINKKSYIAASSHNLVVDEGYRGISIQLIRNYFDQKNIDLHLMTTVSHPTVNKLFKIFNAKELPFKNYNGSLFIILNLESFIEFISRRIHFYGKTKIVKILSRIGCCILFFHLNFWKKKKFSNVTMVKSFDNRFDILWKRYLENQSGIFSFDRSCKSLTWHYSHLIIDKGWVFVYEQDGSITGYIICIEEKNYNNLKKVVVVDLISVTVNPGKVYKTLIWNSIQEAKTRGYDILEFVGFNDAKRAHFLYFKPFKRNFSITPYLYKTENADLGKILLNNSSWCPSMIDGDASI